MDSYKALIIGSGQAGVPLAAALSSAGWKTALVEARYLGGTCINYGCTPTKTMVGSAGVAYLARRAEEYGVQSGPVTVDLAAVRRRKDEVVASFRAGIGRRLEKAGVEVIHGEASFSGPKSLRVALVSGGIRELSAETIIIDTGSRPSVPPIPGLDMVPALDSSSIMNLDQVPAHLAILGGGYVAVEFGQMFRRFGSQVTIIERSASLLSREDPDITAAVRQILEEDGLTILTGSTVRQVEPGPGANIRLYVNTPNGETQVEATHLLVAVGRSPNTESLNLSAAGVDKNERGFVQVNDCLETSVPGIYATGDVNGGPAFTHISYDDYRILKTNLLDGGSATTQGRLVPYTVYMDPQLGRVGLSEEEARRAGREIRVAKMPMEWVARAIEIGATRGLMKAVVDANTQQILGASVLGVEGGELMSAIQIAMLGKLPYPTLRDAVFAHPSLAESLNNLFSNFTD